MDSYLLENHIFKLENSLLQPDVRQSAEKIAEILSDDFIEFCSSGRIYKYEKDDVIDSKNNVGITEYEIKDFSIDILESGVILAKYKVIKQSKLEDKKIYSLRSSIWQCKNGRWKMIFHQGTLTDKFTI